MPIDVIISPSLKPEAQDWSSQSLNLEKINGWAHAESSAKPITIDSVSMLT